MNQAALLGSIEPTMSQVPIQHLNQGFQKYKVSIPTFLFQTMPLDARPDHQGNERMTTTLLNRLLARIRTRRLIASVPVSVRAVDRAVPTRSSRRRKAIRYAIAWMTLAVSMLGTKPALAIDCYSHYPASSAYGQLINFGNITVPSSLAVGSVIATQNSTPDAAQPPAICLVDAAAGASHSTPMPGYSNVFQTKVAGIGVRYTIHTSNGNFFFTDPILTTISGSTNSSQSVFTAELIKTAQVVGSGTLFDPPAGLNNGGVLLTYNRSGNAVLFFSGGGGTIIPVTPTCSLSTASATFNMGTLKTTDFNRGAGATYDWVADQSLRSSSDCNVSTASMTFAGTADPAYPNAFKNNGTANGVALQLWKSGAPQVIPNSTTPITFSAGPNQNFTFSARYIQTEPTVTAGSVNATVTVTVNYQ